jgi:hypothetical protein
MENDTRWTRIRCKTPAFVCCDPLEEESVCVALYKASKKLKRKDFGWGIVNFSFMDPVSRNYPR